MCAFPGTWSRYEKTRSFLHSTHSPFLHSKRPQHYEIHILCVEMGRLLCNNGRFCVDMAGFVSYLEHVPLGGVMLCSNIFRKVAFVIMIRSAVILDTAAATLLRPKYWLSLDFKIYFQFRLKEFEKQAAAIRAGLATIVPIHLVVRNWMMVQPVVLILLLLVLQHIHFI